MENVNSLGLTIELEDLNCDEYMTQFKVENNQLTIRTVGNHDEPIEMKFSEAETRNLAKWLAHATNYRT